MKKTIFTIVLGLVLSIVHADACTSVIVSGKVSPDGRPYIFKNRDTGDTDNLTVLVQGSRYRFVAIVSARDSLNRGVWSGHNEAGFAIANTAAYNLNGKPEQRARQVADHQPRQAEPRENDANIMRKALETCATLSDFEHFLDSLKERGPIPTNSNFAVLDAQGHVAYYETGNQGYVKYDANDPAQAPYGYIVRTNHGMSGDRSLDKGVERYLAINEYMTQAGFTGGLGFDNVIRRVTRYLTHGLTHLNIYDFQPDNDLQAVYFPFRDYIPRYQTASAHLIQGVKEGEDPLLTVSWIIPGSTLSTVAVPVWITQKNELPAIITRNANGRSTLVDAGFELKKQLFPLERGNGSDYINVARLVNRAGTGILQQIEPIEEEIFRHVQPILEAIRKNGKAGKETTEFYQWVDQYVREQYQARFHISL